ncbi:MAG: PQQ-binding-like beta-propeller repeat protein [Acidobacteriota bacterium]
MLSSTPTRLRPVHGIFGVALASLLTVAAVGAADSPTFRGPDRDGHFAAAGLLQEWPKEGPKMLWSTEGLGDSYASMAVADGRIYTTGLVGERGFAFALDLSGKILWKTEYGPAHSGSGYPGSRTTPTVADGRVFLLSSMGEAVALDAKNGKIQWSMNLLEKFGGENIYFGMSESPLVDGGRVIFTAGGKDAALVALDAKSGDVVWTTKGLSDGAAYCNPRIMEHGDHRQIVTLVKEHLVGLDPATGAVLWKTPNKVQYDIHAVSPLFDGDLIYVSHGYDQGGKAYRLAADGRSVKEVWTEADLDVHHGGPVLVDGRIYGAASNKTWHMLDVETGKTLGTLKRLGKGTLIYADGRIYGYLENSKVVLVNPDPKNFGVVSEFEIKKGEGHHWSHPVISNGVLYVRHGDVLMAFDVKA